MNHYNGVVPAERWKNDLLNELRKNNELLEKLLGRDAQPTKQEIEQTQSATKRTYRKRGA